MSQENVGRRLIDAFGPIELQLETLVDRGPHLIRREVVYTNPADALEAVGLSEQDAHADF